MGKPILISGSHRSGSTWIGEILNKSDETGLVFEPFNVDIERNDNPLQYWFEYISDEVDISYEKKVLSYLESFCSLHLWLIMRKIFLLRKTRGVSRLLKDFKGIKSNRTIIKDPIAIMSAEWIFKNIDCDIIITIRHPAAFVASIKVKDWKFEFQNLLDQELLMKDLLSEYRESIEKYAKSSPDIISQGILLWNLIHHVIVSYSNKFSEEWCFVRHEDLSLNPLIEFKNIFKKIGLEFTKEIEKEIIDSTTAEKPSLHKRDSKANIWSWKNRLSIDEIEMIKNGTKDVWTHFYTEDDW